MLGEDHSAINEFPEYKETLEKLSKEDKNFAEKVKQYDAIDREIRKLELAGSPISDEAMHQKKHDRSVLKDELNEQLQKAARA